MNAVKINEKHIVKLNAIFEYLYIVLSPLNGLITSIQMTIAFTIGI